MIKSFVKVKQNLHTNKFYKLASLEKIMVLKHWKREFLSKKMLLGLCQLYMNYITEASNTFVLSDAFHAAELETFRKDDIEDKGSLFFSKLSIKRNTLQGPLLQMNMLPMKPSRSFTGSMHIWDPPLSSLPWKL